MRSLCHSLLDVLVSSPRARDGFYVKGSNFNLKEGFYTTSFCSLAWIFI